MVGWHHQLSLSKLWEFDTSLSKLREMVKDREPGVLQSIGSHMGTRPSD